MSEKNEFAIKSLSELCSGSGQLFDVAKFGTGRVAYHRSGAMFRELLSGVIYYTGRRTDIREESADARRAWCRLTGMRNADLDKAVKLYKEAEKDRYNEAEISDLQREAERLGYSLLKKEIEQ